MIDDISKDQRTEKIQQLYSIPKGRRSKSVLFGKKNGMW